MLNQASERSTLLKSFAMDNTLIDRETLGQFIDELIKKKPLPVDNTEELNNLREESITALDKEIGIAIFGQLNKEQLGEFNEILDREEEPSEEEYKDFFSKNGIDLEKTISDAMQKYAEKFLGGENEQWRKTKFWFSP